uniref:Secreted protein n=1 Tax=Gasterosteus aculeatus TaxID=69293 RepID=G3P964_GASAC
MFRIQWGFGRVMIVVAILPGALRPPRPPEDAGFHHTGVAVDGVGRREPILVANLSVASGTLLDVRTAPFWKRGDFAKRRGGRRPRGLTCFS